MNNSDLFQKCFVEFREYNYDNYRDLLDNSLFEKNLCKRKGDKFYFAFTGFITIKNDLIIVFPKGYDLPSTEEILLSNIRTLAGTLLRYSEEINLDEEERTMLSGENKMTPEGIAPALWLIRDYQEYGFLRREIRQYQERAGQRIDWSRTIKTKQAYHSNSRPIYIDVVSKKSSIDMNNILYRLHRYVVQRSIKKYGWLLGNFQINFEPQDEELPCDLSTADEHIRQELEQTFVNREIAVLQNISYYLLGSGDEHEDTSLNTFATPFFHNVWEVICGYLLKNEYSNLKHIVPKPTWNTQFGKKSTVQKPDILFIEDDELFIVDAKYYDVDREKLPGWHDLVKQFFYYYSLKDIATKTHNILLFPSSKSGIRGVGFVEIESRPDLGKIEALCSDLMEAMSKYKDYQVSKFREQIVRNFTLPQ